MFMTKLKDVLHFYLGCQCYVWDLDGQVFEDTIESVIKNKAGQHRFSIYEFGDVPFENHEEYYQSIKPVLRPFSDITRDEVMEFFGVKGTVTSGNYCAPFFQIEYKDEQGNMQYTHAYITQLSADKFHYLLSKGFDLFNLIESGQAIDQLTKNGLLDGK